MPKRKSSIIWEQYTNDKKGVSKCKHCACFLHHGDSTKALWNHAKAKHADLLQDTYPYSGASVSATTTSRSKSKQMKLDLLNFTAAKRNKYETSSPIQIKLEDAVTKFVYTTLQPFSIVDNPAFRDMISEFDSRYRHISRQEVKNKILKLYDVKRSNIESEMRNIT